MLSNNSFYQKVDLAGKLSKLEGMETQDINGIGLLYELTKIKIIYCPEKVRFNLIHILLNLKWRYNG